MKVSQRISELQTKTVVSTLGWSQCIKGHDSSKVQVQMFFSVHCLMMIYICTIFRETITKGFRVIEQTRLAYCNLQRVIIPKKL